MQWVKKIKLVIISTSLILASHFSAAGVQTKNVEVALLSLSLNSNGNILVQTSPRPNLTGLTCTNSYWLVLGSDEVGFETSVSMLLSAQATKNPIDITAENNGSSDYCLLRRVITKSG